MHLMTELMFRKNRSKKLPSRDIQFHFQPHPKVKKKIRMHSQVLQDSLMIY